MYVNTYYETKIKRYYIDFDLHPLYKPSKCLYYVKKTLKET